MIEQPGVLGEGRERASELEPDVDHLLAALPRRGEALEGLERLLEVGGGLPVGKSPESLDASLREVGNGLLPLLAPGGVVREPLDVLGEALRVERLGTSTRISRIGTTTRLPSSGRNPPLRSSARGSECLIGSDMRCTLHRSPRR